MRRALAHAIDRELIVRTILDSLVPVDERPDPAAVVGLRAERASYDYDPAGARALLDEAGWTRRRGWRSRKDGSRSRSR